MFISEKIYKIVTIFLFALFAIALFFTVMFLKNKMVMATAPSQEVIKNNSLDFDKETFNKALEKLK